MAREVAMQTLRRELLQENHDDDVNVEAEEQHAHHVHHTPARRVYLPRGSIGTGAGPVHHITREVVVGLGVDEEREDDEERKISEEEDQEVGCHEEMIILFPSDPSRVDL